MSNKPIKVSIDHSKFWTLASGHPCEMNVSVFKALRDAGIPVDGAIDMRGVTSGRLVMWNEIVDGQRFCVYEWTPGPDTIVQIKQQAPAAVAPAVYEEF